MASKRDAVLTESPTECGLFRHHTPAERCLLIELMLRSRRLPVNGRMAFSETRGGLKMRHIEGGGQQVVRAACGVRLPCLRQGRKLQTEESSGVGISAHNVRVRRNWRAADE